jgi:sugar O-acyltransferase (sialic acid O-acetyltransferase NeuD family)
VRAQPHNTLLILGAGGHGRVVADAALAQGGWERVIATDRDPARCNGDLLPGVPTRPLADAMSAASAVHVAIGAASARQRELKAASLPLASVIHPRASVSRFAQIGEGSFVAANAVVAPGAVLGTSVIVNHGAIVDHDVEVGEFTHVAPHVALSGNVRIGARVLVGAGANILPGIRIADDVVIGAGAVVTGNIEAAGVYAGVPARRVR